MTLNADIPLLPCLVRREYLYDLTKGHGEFVQAAAFGIASLQGRAVGFHVMILEPGAVIWRLPVSALAHSICDPQPLDHLELWDCFSYELAVTEFDFLAGRRLRTLLKDGKPYDGRYVLTIDWYGNSYSELPGEIGHKCGHLIRLDNGNFAIQPNNRILWADAATNPEPFKNVPDYITNNREWRCEHETKWTTIGDRMFYGVKKHT